MAIGTTGAAQGGPGAAPALITVRVGAATVLDNEPVAALRDVWESTSFALEARQCAPACVASERAQLLTRAGPVYKVPPPSPIPPCFRALLLNPDLTSCHCLMRCVVVMQCRCRSTSRRRRRCRRRGRGGTVWRWCGKKAPTATARCWPPSTSRASRPGMSTCTLNAARPCYYPFLSSGFHTEAILVRALTTMTLF